MQVKRLPDGTYALTCDEFELLLIVEGLYTVEDTGATSKLAFLTSSVHRCSRTS